MDVSTLRRFGGSILFGHGLAVEKHFYDKAVSTKPLARRTLPRSMPAA